jgi:DNA-binding transcriptional LysR family regulator
VVMPAGHRLATRRRIGIAQLAGERWVLMSPGHGLRARAEELCRAGGFEPVIGFEGHDLGTLHALIGAGRGVGLFPAHPPARGDTRSVSLTPRQTRTIGLVTMPGRASPRSVERFAELVRANAAGL